MNFFVIYQLFQFCPIFQFCPNFQFSPIFQFCPIFRASPKSVQSVQGRPERPGASRASTVVNRAEPILPSWMAACGRFLVKTKKGPLRFRNQKSVYCPSKPLYFISIYLLFTLKKKKKTISSQSRLFSAKIQITEFLTPKFFFFRVQEKLPTCLANLSKCSINNCYDCLAIFFSKNVFLG